MLTCSYCGAEYPDGTAMCSIDQTPLALPTAAPAPVTPAAPDVAPTEFEFPPLTEAQRQLDLVTLVSCGTLISAEMIACRLRAAGIDVFIPDQSLAQTMGFNLAAVGFVRVQIAPADYDAAKALLSEGN